MEKYEDKIVAIFDPQGRYQDLDTCRDEFSWLEVTDLYPWPNEAYDKSMYVEPPPEDDDGNVRPELMEELVVVVINSSNNKLYKYALSKKQAKELKKHGEVQVGFMSGKVTLKITKATVLRADVHYSYEKNRKKVLKNPSSIADGVAALKQEKLKLDNLYD